MRESLAVSVQSESLVPVSTIRRTTQESAQPLESPAHSVEQRLRDAAVAADEQGVLQHVGMLWPGLAAGRLQVVDAFYTSQRWFVVLAETAAANEPGRPSPRSWLVLQQLLFGQRQKVAAIESGVAPSTVSAWLHRALTDMGVAHTARKVPPMLALLARAGAGHQVPACRVSPFTHAPRSCLALSIRRPELHLAHKVPAAEYAVLCGIIEGRAYADVAAERGTSVRTIANQVASMFHRLGVSGRGELITYLLTESPSADEATGPRTK